MSEHDEQQIEDLDVDVAEAADVKGGAFDAFRMQHKTDAVGGNGLLLPAVKSSIIAV